MYDTSELYKSIVAGEHWFETRVRIAGNYVPQSQLLEVSADYRVFSGSQPSVGGCLAGELTVRLLKPSFYIPRMARVEPFVRATDGTQTSEWIPQGKFFIDTRETTDNDDDLPILTLHCYDAMLKTEGDFPPTTSHDWPATDYRVASDIAGALGTGINARTRDLLDTTTKYIGLPVGYSMREVLSNIAAKYAGNWVVDYDGRFLLIPLTSLPVETNYLIDAIGEPITFGGDRILV